jgi:hypothetical protein
MRKKKYLLVTTDEESNIGVIDLGTDGKSNRAIKNTLKLMLEEHFDCEITITGVDPKSSIPIHLEVDAESVDDSGSKYEFSVHLEQTWMY